MEPAGSARPRTLDGRKGATGDLLRDAVAGVGIAIDARILVAVSGGPDSVALLDVFCRAHAGEHPEWSVRVAHINHGLRGEESEEDERFVRELARARGLECDVARVDVAAPDRRRKPWAEEAARDLRYAALRDMLARWPGDVIATGHTANDQAETLMMRLLRGTGLTGLAGIRSSGPDLVRPFLSIAREVILSDLQERGQAYRVDSSNLDLRHRRNLIRHTVMPALLQVQPKAIRTLSRAARVLQTDGEYLESEVARTTRLALLAEPDEGSDGSCTNEGPAAAGLWASTGNTASRAVWMSLHRALRAGVLRKMSARALGADEHRADPRSRSQQARVELDTAAVDRMSAAIEGADSVRVQRTPIAGGLVLESGSHTFSIRLGAAEAQPSPEPVTLALPRRSEALARTGLSATSIGVEATADEPCAETASQLGALRAFRDELEPGDLARAVAVSGPMHAWVDAGKIGARLVLRTRRAGDRMRPLGMGGSRKLHDLLIDRHVPMTVRDRVPIVENGAQIVWIPGIALDERVAIDSNTREVLHLVFQPHARRPT